MSGIIDRLGGSFFGGGTGTPRSDRLVYAVGDIHGRTDLLAPMMEKILTDVVTSPAQPEPPPVIFLGDMIDRGPDTRGTLEFLLAVTEWPEIEAVFLAGNHEAMLLAFLDDPVTNRHWLQYGGYEALVSYGLGELGDLGDERELQRIARELRAAMGGHVDLLQSCVHWCQDGNMVFVHAGAEPDRPMSDQPLRVLMWGSQNFERKRRTDGLWVVHGHNIVDALSVRRGRIALDTGAYKTGVLTAMRVVGTDVRFMQETGPAAAVLE